MYRLCAIHHVAKHEVESGWKSGYYAAILGGKEDGGLWSTNTAKHFASSLRQPSHAGKLICFGEW